MGYSFGYSTQKPESGVDFRELREVNSTTYSADIPDRIVHILEAYRRNAIRERLCIEYGNTETGKSWGDTDCGYIGRSTGNVKVPLVIHNSRSYGGSAILDHCIVRILTAKGKYVLYQHPNYHTDK